jgi:hypothetical protein
MGCPACGLVIMLTELFWLAYVSLLFDILFGYVGKHEYFQLVWVQLMLFED